MTRMPTLPLVGMISFLFLLYCTIGSNGYQPAHLRNKIASSIAKGERRAYERNAIRREFCTKCNRPFPVQCICDCLPPERITLPTTDVLILQHPTEFRRKHFSTVPLIKLVLDNMQIYVGRSFDLNTPPIAEAIASGHKLLLLYPGKDAIDLDLHDITTATDYDIGSALGSDTTETTTRCTNKSSVPSSGRNLLILVDGTWSQAKSMLGKSPELLKYCQKIKFTADSLSIYNAIRKEPEPHCVSTLEACAQALVLLERDHQQVAENAKKYLLAALKDLVRIQLLHLERDNDIDTCPRFVGKKGTRALIKRQRRLEIETEMFAASSDSSGIDGANNDDAVDKHLQTIDLGYSAIMRPLLPSDIDFIDSRWPYQSKKSRTMILQNIEMDAPYCLGIEKDGDLKAFIMRYRNGALGMLHVEEAYQRRGYATNLLAEATRRLEEKKHACCAYIVDGNSISESLFAKLGWVREDPNAKRGTGNRRASRKWIKRYVLETPKREKLLLLAEKRRETLQKIAERKSFDFVDQ